MTLQPVLLNYNGHMTKSKVYHDQSPAFGLGEMLGKVFSEQVFQEAGIKPPFTGGPLADRFKLVAIVDSNSLDEVFRLTNHIDHAWTDNEEVEPVGPQHRSTSVGDLVQLPTGKWYLCDLVGWKEIEVCE